MSYWDQRGFRGEPVITHLKTFTPPQDQVTQWDANVLVENLAMTLRSIIIPENPHRPDDGHARGIGGDEDYTLLLVNVGVVRITLAHDDVDSRPRVSSSADPPTTCIKHLRRQKESRVTNAPLAPIDDNLVSLLLDRRANVRRVRR